MATVGPGRPSTVLRGAVGEKSFEGRERYPLRRRGEHRNGQVLEAGFAGPGPDVFEHQISFRHPVTPHLVLGLCILRVVGTGLGEAGDTAGSEHPAHLEQHVAHVRDVMQCVEAQNPVDTRIVEVHPVTVEDAELRGRLNPEDGLLLVAATTEIDHGLGYVHGDDPAAHLGQEVARPATACTEVENRHAGKGRQTTQQ